jgi:hypothetical protein
LYIVVQSTSVKVKFDQANFLSLPINTSFCKILALRRNINSFIYYNDN